jgi:hypothetical protein
MNLKIVVERKSGFTQPVNVYMLWNPPGVGSASGLTIPGNQNEILYPMNAAPGAAARKWKICVIANAAVGNGPIWVSSQLVTVEVAPPYVALAMDRSAVEQGKETEMVCKVQQLVPFTGTAKAKLLGLPHAVTAPDVDLTKDTKELVFKVKTDKGSPPGQHQNIFAQVVLTQNDEPVVLNTGGTVLRIDPPPPPKPNQPAAPVAAKPPPAAPKPAEKRLTRLEQLRLEQAEREKAAKDGAPKPGGKE